MPLMTSSQEIVVSGESHDHFPRILFDRRKSSSAVHARGEGSQALPQRGIMEELVTVS